MEADHPSYVSGRISTGYPALVVFATELEKLCALATEEYPGNEHRVAPVPVDPHQPKTALSQLAAGAVFLLAADNTLNAWMVSGIPNSVKDREVYATRLDGKSARPFDSGCKAVGIKRAVAFDVRLERGLRPVEE